MSKLGNKESECEDSISFNLKRGRFAIADGASSSMFSDVWASCLTSNIITLDTDLYKNTTELFRTLIPISRREWYSRIEWNNLKWFQTNKSFQGSYSTLLYVEIKRLEGLDIFRALAVGDSCLFIVNSDKKLYSFPYRKASQFNNTPKLVWTGKKAQVNIESEPVYPDFVTTSGHIHKGDEMILATDALSKWLIETRNFRAIRELITDEKALHDFLSSEIDGRRMRNDDVSIIYLKESCA